MNRTELIQQLAAQAGITHAEASRAVDALFSPENGVIHRALTGGETVEIAGFGRFEAGPGIELVGFPDAVHGSGREEDVRDYGGYPLEAHPGIGEADVGPRGPGDGGRRHAGEGFTSAGGTHGAGDGGRKNEPKASGETVF